MTLNLSWTESISTASQIEKYQVWRAEVAVDVQPPIDEFTKIFEIDVERDAFGAITNGNELYSYQDLAADPNTFFYFYFIKAIPVQGPASRSAVVSPAGGGGGAPLGKLTMDADFVPSLVTQSFDIQWNNPANGPVPNFIVQRSVNGSGFTTIATLANNVFSYNDANAINRVTNTYAYRVQASIRTSNTESFALVAAPTAPVLSGNFDAPNNEFDLTWTAATSAVGISGYEIERSVNAGSFSVIDTVSGSTLAYTDNDPTIDRLTNSYDYRIRATDGIGQTATSNTLNFPVLSEQFVIFDADDPAWIVPAGVSLIDILAIGAGAGGGVDANIGEPSGGGGGGGAVRESLAVAVSPGDSLNILVGVGGAAGQIFGGLPGPGSDSVVHNTTTATELFRAGGGGAYNGSDGGNGSNGSSGGGGGADPIILGALIPPGTGSAPGNNGGTGFLNNGVLNNNAAGGGGGAGAAGGNAASANPGNGGNGTPVSGWGAADGTYGGGGGGWGYNNVPTAIFGTRGSGGGAANTGGGGNAGPISGGVAENGFSGRVVLRYLG